MNMLILHEAAQAEVDELNQSGEADRQLEAIELATGDAALSASLLTDCAEGQTWGHYGEFLETLPLAEVGPEMIVEPQVV
jgi:hypothetical protein